MATGFLFRSSDDVGAPVLSGTIGAAIPVFDHILDVSNPASYWEKVFTGTNKAVYRAKEGERRYLRVDDSAATVAYVRMYESMTDVDTGVDPTPTIAQRAATAFYFLKSSAASSAARPYACVSDSRYFKLVSMYSTGNNCTGMTFGEATMFDPLDAYPSMIEAAVGTTDAVNNGAAITHYPVEYAIDTNGSNRYFARNIDGTQKSVAHAMRGGYSTAAQVGNLANSPVINLGQFFYCDPKGFMSNQSQGYERAIQPYLYATSCAVNTAIVSLNTDYTIGGKTYRFYQADSSTSHMIALLVSNHEAGRV